MKDDYFVMFKKSMSLVFNALLCKYEDIHAVYIEVLRLLLFWMVLHVSIWSTILSPLCHV